MEQTQTNQIKVLDKVKAFALGFGAGSSLVISKVAGMVNSVTQGVSNAFYHLERKTSDYSHNIVQESEELVDYSLHFDDECHKTGKIMLSGEATGVTFTVAAPLGLVMAYALAINNNDAPEVTPNAAYSVEGDCDGAELKVTVSKDGTPELTLDGENGCKLVAPAPAAR